VFPESSNKNKRLPVIIEDYYGPVEYDEGYERKHVKVLY